MGLKAGGEGSRHCLLGVGVAASLVVAVACGPKTITLEPTTHSYTPEEYESVYRAWTRVATPFDFERMESVLRVTATFEARPFRWAYVVRYARDFGLTVDERNVLLRASLEDAEHYHRFFVTLAAGSQVDDVELTFDQTAWRVVLMDDRGHQTTPLSIERLRRPTPAQETYFPTVSSQRRAFRLAFPVRDEQGQLTVPEDSLFASLRFTGPRGTVDLKWRFPLDKRRRRRLAERRDQDEASSEQ